MNIRRLAIIAWNQRKAPTLDEDWNAEHGLCTRAEWDALSELADSLWGLENSNCHKLTAAEVWAAGHTIVYGRTLQSTKRRHHG